MTLTSSYTKALSNLITNLGTAMLEFDEESSPMLKRRDLKVGEDGHSYHPLPKKAKVKEIKTTEEESNIPAFVSRLVCKLQTDVVSALDGNPLCKHRQMF